MSHALFLELTRTHRKALVRLAGAYARGLDREDLLQEMWLQIWRSLPAYRAEAALGTWAFRIALNTALSHVRREVRRRDAASDYARSVPEPASAGGRGEHQILDEFLSSLGEIDRAVMLLYLEGLPHRDMGEVLGHSEGAIGVRITRLKALFKRRYLEE